MFKVSAVPPRRSAVLTGFRGATTINDGTTVEPRRSWRCHCGVCRTSTAVAPRLRCDGVITENIEKDPRWAMILADDLVMCAMTREEVEEDLETGRVVFERHGLKISRTKTK